MVTKRSNVEVAKDDDEQIQFPPEAVQELVRLAIDSGGDPQTIQGALDPTPIPVNAFPYYYHSLFVFWGFINCWVQKCNYHNFMPIN